MVSIKDSTIAHPPAERLSIALAVLRGVVGLVFLAHGAQKLFVYGLGGVTGAFAEAGIPLAALAGPVVSFVELLGGIALILGLYTRIAGAALAVVMAGAVLFVHLAAGFFAPDGVEFVLTLLAALIAVTLTGPGSLSLDAVRARRRIEASWSGHTATTA